MANLNPKPFTLSQKIFRRLFAGKPSLYTDVDINQQGAIDDKTFDKLFDYLGSVTTGYLPSAVISWDNNLGFDVTYAGGGKLFYKKVEFDIPAFHFVKGDSVGNPAIAILPTPANPGLTAGVINFYLVAKRYTTTFADDATIAGVDGVGLASPLPSSDAVRFKDERVVMSIGQDVAPTLASGEEKIVLLSQIAFVDDAMNQYGGVHPYLQINCPDITQLEDKFFQGSHNVSTNTTGVISNLVKLADSLTARVDNGLYNLYNSLVERQGTVKFYYGPLAGNFDSNGLGIGRWSGYALLNGQTHSGYTTPDARGRQIMVFHSYAGDSQNEYKVMGETGPPAGPGANCYSLVAGGKQVKFGLQSLPAHRHKYGFAIMNYSFAVGATPPAGSESLPSGTAGALNNPIQLWNNNAGDTGGSGDTHYYLFNTGDGTDNVNAQDGFGINYPVENRSPYIVMAAVIKL